MVKLPDKLEVVARIRYHSRGYINLLERNEAYRAAGREAARTGRRGRPGRPLRPVAAARRRSPPARCAIDWKFVPSTQLAGDMFGYHWLDTDHLAIYLLDVSGHGVGSALLAVSAANVLSAGGAAGHRLPRPRRRCMTKLNDMFQMERQDGKYFTIWYGVYRPGRAARSRTATPATRRHSCHSGGAVQQLEADGPGGRHGAGVALRHAHRRRSAKARGC